jgi:hypothetical protein
MSPGIITACCQCPLLVLTVSSNLPSYRFQKDDNVAHPIDPKDEQWGYTVEGGEVINLEPIIKNEKKKPKKGNKKKIGA